MFDLREMWAIEFSPPPSRGSFCVERNSASVPGRNRWNPNAGALRVSVARTRILTHLFTQKHKHTRLLLQIIDGKTHLYIMYFNRFAFNSSQQVNGGFCFFSYTSAFHIDSISFSGFITVKYCPDFTRFNRDFL